MKKIIVFGNSSSGKSSLAKKLAAEHQLAHLDLDTLAWQHTEPPVRKPLKESQSSITAFTQANDGWVIEGCYTDLLEWVSDYANQAIFINLPVSLCQEHAKQRPWEPHKYPSKAAQDANLPMLLEWIAAYQTRTDDFSYKAHLALYNRFLNNKQMMTKNTP